MPEKAEALGILLVLLPGFACAYIVQILAVRRKQTELDKIIEALLFSLLLYVLTLPFFGNTLPISWRQQHLSPPALDIPILDSSSIVRQVPLSEVPTFLQAGGKRVYKLQDPTGTTRWIPEDELSSALKAGGKPSNDLEARRIYAALLSIEGSAGSEEDEAVEAAPFQVVVQWPHLAALAGLAFLLALLYASNINHDWMMKLFRKMRVTERTARSTIWNDAFQEIGGFVQVGISDGRSVIGWLRDYSDDGGEPSLFLEEAAWVMKQTDGTTSEVSIEGPGILLTKET
jgi:hypothetical protein